MIKDILNYSYIIVLTFSFNLSQAQVTNYALGKVIKYAIFRDSISNPIKLDSITGQFRAISIDTIAKKVWVIWQIGNDTIGGEYSIEKIYSSLTFNVSTKRIEKYLNFLTLDNKDYPLLIVLSKDLKLVYFYYYWNKAKKMFTKSEKIELNDRGKLFYH